MMFANQHTVRIVILLIIIGSTLAAFPRKNTTKLQHTYVDYLNEKWCKNIPKYQAVQAPTVRKDRMFSNLIQVDIDQIAKGNLFHSVTFNSSFFISLFVHGGCFVYFWLTLRRLSVYNNKAIKSSIKLSEPLAIKHNNKKYLIFKGLILALLLCNAYFSIVGMNISQEIEKGLDQLLCGLVSIPDHFERMGGKEPNIPSNYTIFNDYQYQTMALRELFKEAHSGLTYLQQLHRQNKFIAEISKSSLNLSTDQPKGFISHLIKTFQLSPSLINQTKFMEVSLIYLRGALYWIKGGNIFANSLLNSYYSLDKMPTLIASVVSQIYQILLLCFLGVFCAIVFMSLRNTSKQGVIVKYIILGLSFSTLICIGFSSLGVYLLPVPKQVCNILTKYDNKAELIDKVTANMHLAEVVRPTLMQLMERMSRQSDGNMAFIDPEVYQNMHNQQQQIKALLAYDNIKDIQAKIVSQFPDIIQAARAYFANYTNVTIRLKEISTIFDKITSSVSKQGSFGRLTIRPLGEHFQALQHNLCNVNLSIWSKNTDNLLSCAITSLMIMISLALYLRSKLKGDYQWANAEDDHFELTSISQ